ncbi:hypothetical protein ACWCXL_12160 [Streptomyces sp. NPDC001588]
MALNNTREVTRSRRNYLWILAVTTTTGGGAYVTANALGLEPFILTGATATLAAIIAYLFDRSQDAGVAPRERLREAEQQLEDSLRTPSAISVGGEVHGPILVRIDPAGLNGDGVRPEEDPTDLQPSPPPPPTEVQPPRPLALANLWAVTNRRLDLYHDIATRQARQSFRNAQAAMVIGFLLLASFVTVALKASTTTGAVVAGGLGAVSAALAGYVSRTFVKSQETAAGHLKAYFDQPLEFARYLTAERLITESGLTEEQRREAVIVLVKGLAAPPGATAMEVSDQQKAQ